MFRRIKALFISDEEFIEQLQKEVTERAENVQQRLKNAKTPHERIKSRIVSAETWKMLYYPDSYIIERLVRRYEKRISLFLGLIILLSWVGLANLAKPLLSSKNKVGLALGLVLISVFCVYTFIEGQWLTKSAMLNYKKSLSMRFQEEPKDN